MHITAGRKILKRPGKKNLVKSNWQFSTFSPVQKWIFGHFWNCKKWNFAKKNSVEIDLIDFTSFFGQDFLKFSSPLCIYQSHYEIFMRNIIFKKSLRKVTISINCSLVANRKFECFSIHYKSDFSSRAFSVLKVNFRNRWSIWDVNIGGNFQFQISFDFLSQRRGIFYGCLMIEFQFFRWRISWPGVRNQKVILPCWRFQGLFVAHITI